MFALYPNLKKLHIPLPNLTVSQFNSINGFTKLELVTFELYAPRLTKDDDHHKNNLKFIKLRGLDDTVRDEISGSDLFDVIQVDGNRNLRMAIDRHTMDREASQRKRPFA